MAWLNRFGWLLGPKDTKAKIVMAGLVDSGKSTIMQQLKPCEVKMTELPPNIPIVGLHGEGFTYKSLNFVSFDLGDLDCIGNPWEDHFRDCDGIIFVVDSSDTLNIPVVKYQFEKLLRDQHVQEHDTCPVLVLANKNDRYSAVSALQMTQLLGISRSIRPVDVFCTDALTGEGLNEGLNWLAHNIRPICAKS